MLGGILAGALSGGAQAADQLATDQIKQNQDAARAKLESELAVERERQVARLREQIRREGNAYDTVGEGGQNKLKYKELETDLATRQEVWRRQQIDPIDVDKEAKIEKAKADVETETTIARGNNKKYTKAKENIATALESPSLRASRAASTEGQQLENKIKRDLWDLELQRREAIKAGDTAKAQQIEEMQNRTAGKAGDTGYEIVKTIRETDPLTGETKERTETTVRRPAPAAASPAAGVPPSGAPYKEGQRLRGPDGKLYIVQNGRPVPYAGK